MGTSWICCASSRFPGGNLPSACRSQGLAVLAQDGSHCDTVSSGPTGSFRVGYVTCRLPACMPDTGVRPQAASVGPGPACFSPPRPHNPPQPGQPAADAGVPGWLLAPVQGQRPLHGSGPVGPRSSLVNACGESFLLHVAVFLISPGLCLGRLAGRLRQPERIT